MTWLRRLLGRGKDEAREEGILYPQVRTAMADAQAYARSHGGQIQLLGVSDDGDVRIRMTGACNGCPMSDITLKLGIENQLRAAVPGVRRVVQVL